jgi:peptidoglycan/LPS O-acetylase OafA/YrhL
MNLSYRPEIDGLRALAVSTVVLYHANIPGFGNGFIGVDIFFVISGYLITSIIVKQQAQDEFSYREFIVRRARRILPALLVVMLAFIPFALWLMLPDPLENFGQSLVATSFSANNILLWLTTGYWDLASEYKPLLHTWSLGVEEQFYIFYPFILLLCLKLPLRACYACLVILAVISFAFMVYSLQNDPAGAFYLLHCRAWQLLTGGIAGLASIHMKIERRPLLAGLGLILNLIALISWPGVKIPMQITLLLVTAGTALYLVWSDKSGKIGWIFTRQPVIFIGLISYSLYLWHQPIFAFIRIAMFEEPSMAHFGLGILAACGFSVLSWKYVEKPFRSATITSSRFFWTATGISMTVIVAIGMTLNLSGGLPQRLEYSGSSVPSGATIAYNERIKRLLPSTVPATGTDRPVVLIAGNSFARDISNVLLEAGLDSSLFLLYREHMSPCVSDWSGPERRLASSVDMIIFASGAYAQDCVDQTLRLDAPVKFVGPKQFGHNLNPLVRYSPEMRSTIRLPILEEIRLKNANQVKSIGDRYVNMINILSEDGKNIRVADDHGSLLTTDQIHFSRAGAIFAAEHLHELLPELLELARPDRNSNAEH